MSTDPAAFGGQDPLASRLLVGLTRRRNGSVPHKLVCLLLSSHFQPGVLGRVSLPHPFGIVVHEQAVIGDRVTIHQHVTIGAAVRGGPAPVIGDGVVIGVGAVILGAIVVGDGAVVGANAVVVGDVEPGATVGGVPARVLHPRAT